jgi:hypothetical protein
VSLKKVDVLVRGGSCGGRWKERKGRGIMSELLKGSKTDFAPLTEWEFCELLLIFVI